MINTIIRLRRDNDYNYAKIKDKFIPANGEICLVDTARSGLRAVCGDGIKTFGQLEYIDNFIIKGYYNNNIFYKDRDWTEPYDSLIDRIYIDIQTNSLYYYTGTNFQTIGGTVSAASEFTPGIMKLYHSIGQNTDGTMSQKAITDELDDKVEVALNIDEELLIFVKD